MSKKLFVGFLVFVFLWICALIQIDFLNQVPLWGMPANIGIVVIVGIGLFADKIPGILVGAGYGLIIDILFGKCLGVYFAIYALLGFLSGILSSKVSKDNRMSFVYMTAMYTAGVELLLYFIFILIYQYPIEIVPFIVRLMKEVIYNMILAGLLFKLVGGISEMINKSKNSYYLL